MTLTGVPSIPPWEGNGPFWRQKERRISFGNSIKIQFAFRRGEGGKLKSGQASGLRSRQLRFLYLQPGSVFRELGAQVEVRRNDQVRVADIDAMHPERIVISPGPCTPQDAGISIDLIRHFAGKIPILGVCLGHQAIGAAFGGDVVRAPHLMHGKTSAVSHDNKTIFLGLPMPHERHSLPLAHRGRKRFARGTGSQRLDDGERWNRTIMGLRHRKFASRECNFI